MPWVLAILVLLLGIGAPALGSFFWADFAEEQAVDAWLQASQHYIVLDMDDLQKDAGLQPDLLVASQSGLPSEEFQWVPIILDLKEDEAWRRRNFEQFKGALSTVPLPGTCFLLGAGLAAIGIVRKRSKG